MKNLVWVTGLQYRHISDCILNVCVCRMNRSFECGGLLVMRERSKARMLRQHEDLSRSPDWKLPEDHIPPHERVWGIRPRFQTSHVR